MTKFILLNEKNNTRTPRDIQNNEKYLPMNNYLKHVLFSMNGKNKRRVQSLLIHIAVYIICHIFGFIHEVYFVI